MDGPRLAMNGEPLEHRGQEPDELDLAHLAARHGELAVVNLAKTGDIALNRDIVGWVREHELGGIRRGCAQNQAWYDRS